MFRAPLLAFALGPLAVLSAQVPGPTAELIYFTVDGQEGSQPLLPGFELHSSWSGLGVASTGDVYIAVSNHNQPRGNVALFKYDTRAGQINLLDDLKSVSTAAGNWMAAESQYKVHSFLMEHEPALDGRLGVEIAFLDAESQ